MAMEVVDEDEILFADINKQISLLIMDDDAAADHLPYPPVSYQVYEPITQQSTQVFKYEQSKGTGVFIPRSTHRNRRKSKQGRSNTDYNNGATSKNNSQGIVVSNNFTCCTSFNYKRI